MPVAIRRAIEVPSRAESILGRKEAFHGQGRGEALADYPMGTRFRSPSLLAFVVFFFLFFFKKKKKVRPKDQTRFEDDDPRGLANAVQKMWSETPDPLSDVETGGAT